MDRGAWTALVSELAAALSAGNSGPVPALLVPVLVQGGGQSNLERTAELELASLRRAFPDFQCRAEILWTTPDRCVVRWQAEGTHLEDYHGLWPSRQRISVGGLAIIGAEANQVRRIEVYPSLPSLIGLLAAYLPMDGL